jgi:hypothetical protein
MDNNLLVIQNQKEKLESVNFKRRRFEQWNENYALYRDSVATNRLTQRQPINIPIMRETIQTWISKIDEAPELKFESRGRTNKNKTGEIIVDSIWAHYFDKLKLDVLDNLDKKVVGLQGRSFKIVGYSRGELFIDIIDPYDIEISPKVNPLDLNTAQYIIRTHIFKPLKEILANEKYNNDAKEELKVFLTSKEGIVKAEEASEAYQDKVERLQNLGATEFDNFNSSEVLVELNESYKLVWNSKNNQYVRHLIIIAADRQVLYNEPIKEALGISRLPIVSWADDPDLNDIWCDGKGDSVRTINKVVNMYISQDVENRAYRNFGMRFYNTLNGTFSPQGFDPKPFAMFGVPGNPKDIIQEIEIQPLGDTTNQIGFLKDLIQSSVAQTATERGEQTKSRTTLGEVELNLQQSQGRNTVTAKNYRRAWEELGEIFYELISNNSNGTITLWKKGTDGDLYKKEISGTDWNFPEGYNTKVVMRSEKDSMDQFDLQRVQYTIANFQDNPVATKIAKRKQLELMDWRADEIDQAMQFYENQQQPQLAEEVEKPTGQATGRPFNNQQMLQQTNA